MELLVLAHRGEAQAFLSELGFEPRDNEIQLYESENLDLLITGEGYIEAMKKTLLALKDKPYERVINLGIAGSLSLKLQTGNIAHIRTSYRYFDHTPIFKSFTSYNPEAEFDCITTNKRIVDSDDAKALKVHGDLVDRELWGIAEACHFFNTPFEALKLISDQAGDTDCQLVASQATDYSYELYEHFFALKKIEIRSSDLDEKTVRFIKSLAPTFSQKVQLESLFKKCEIKGMIPDNIFDLSGYKDWPRKKRNQDIIKKLGELVDPIQSQLNNYCQQISTTHLKAIANPEFVQVDLRARVQSQKELDELIKELKNFDIKTLEQMYEGNL